MDQTLVPIGTVPAVPPGFAEETEEWLMVNGPFGFSRDVKEAGEPDGNCIASSNSVL